tara:strand:- start:671 stop:1939 length:1269 start_codon:yes stop_codon:yes gene_type:complete
MTAGGSNEWGDDSPKNRFVDPATGEAYFLIIDKKTGKTKIYNEEWGSDKYIGEYDPDTGKIKYNNNWWGGARKEEKAFFNDNKNLIKNQAKKVIKNEEVAAGKSNQEANNIAAKTMGASTPVFEESTSVDGTLGGGLGTLKSGKPKFVYPITLRDEGNAQDTIQITMIEYRTSGFDKDTKSISNVKNRGDITAKKKPLGTVILPIPGGISAGNGTSWSEGNMSAFDAVKANIILTAGQEGIKEAATLMGDKLKQAGKSGDVKNALLNAIASSSGNAKDLQQRTTGEVMNPNMELLFKGPSLRSFTFDFDLAPRSKKEGETVIQLIRFLKQGMAPIRTKERLFLKTPNTFELKYTHRGGEHKGLNKFKECALENVNVDYTPDANYSTYDDGLMTKYKMQLTFKELEPIYNDDYGKRLNKEIGF